MTHNDVLASRLFLVIAPRARGTKSTRTQTRNESFGLEKWYRCFYAMRFDIDQSRDGLARHFLRALFSSRCKNPRELFWASFGGRGGLFPSLNLCPSLSHLRALRALLSSFCELTRTFSVTQTHSVTFIPSKYIYNHGDGEDEREHLPQVRTKSIFSLPSQ